MLPTSSPNIARNQRASTGQRRRALQSAMRTVMARFLGPPGAASTFVLMLGSSGLKATDFVKGSWPRGPAALGVKIAHGMVDRPARTDEGPSGPIGRDLRPDGLATAAGPRARPSGFLALHLRAGRGRTARRRQVADLLDE